MIEVTEKNIERAIERARIEKPRVRVIEFGVYSVTNKQTGANYTVTAKRANGKKLVSCTCPAGKKSVLCKHAASILGIHIQLASERAGK